MSRNYCVGYFNTVSLILSVRPCASSPCVNGGNCKNLKKSFQCTCPAGYKGNRCQIKGKVKSCTFTLY